MIQAHWMEHKDKNTTYYECSNCHYDDVYDIEDMDYCNKCGASMKKVSSNGTTKRFIFEGQVRIPPERLASVAKVARSIKRHTGVNINYSDAYRLWEAVSERCRSKWLQVLIPPAGMSQREYFEDLLNNYGIVIEE